MIATLKSRRQLWAVLRGSLHRMRPSLSLFTLLVLFQALALAQSPFDTGFNAMQTLFTGTIAKVATATYVFRENVKNNELAVNPLGLTIVRFRADQAFE
jgi:hypothetical protein